MTDRGDLGSIVLGRDGRLLIEDGAEADLRPPLELVEHHMGEHTEQIHARYEQSIAATPDYAGIEAQIEQILTQNAGRDISQPMTSYLNEMEAIGEKNLQIILKYMADIGSPERLIRKHQQIDVHANSFRLELSEDEHLALALITHVTDDNPYAVVQQYHTAKENQQIPTHVQQLTTFLQDYRNSISENNVRSQV
ncbi:MAG: hypothetical protein ABIC95_05705 [archaeon]